VSYDLYFWPAGVTDDPDPLAARLAEGETDDLAPDPRVLAFRGELSTRQRHRGRGDLRGSGLRRHADPHQDRGCAGRLR
jgi:hypothetical protein